MDSQPDADGLGGGEVVRRVDEQHHTEAIHRPGSDTILLDASVMVEGETVAKRRVGYYLEVSAKEDTVRRWSPSLVNVTGLPVEGALLDEIVLGLGHVLSLPLTQGTHREDYVLLGLGHYSHFVSHILYILISTSFAANLQQSREPLSRLNWPGDMP